MTYKQAQSRAGKAGRGKCKARTREQCQAAARARWTRVTLRAVLATIGCTLDDDGFTLNCDAPRGYVWEANGLPSIAIAYASNGAGSWLSDAVTAQLGELQMGLRKVIDAVELAECRHNLGDDEWEAPADSPDRREWPTKQQTTETKGE